MYIMLNVLYMVPIVALFVLFVATQNEISRQTEICFFSAEIFWVILPALICVLVRLTKFVAWGLDDGLLLPLVARAGTLPI